MTETLLNEQNVYWILWLNTLLHELGVPVPMTPTAMVAGARVVTGGVSPILLVLSIVVAMTLGNAAWFAAGRRYGSAVLKLLCRVSISPDTCVARTEGTFGRWGWSALVIGRFLPGVTLVAPPLAGALGMPWSKFLLLTSGRFRAVWCRGRRPGNAAARSDRSTAVSGLDVRLGSGGDIDRVACGLHRVALVASPNGARGRHTAHRRARAARVDRGRRTARADRRPCPRCNELDQRRIPGASIMHLDEIEAGKFTGARDRQIVVYCSCPNEASAAKAVRLLHRHGYLRARPLRGGLDAWFASEQPPASAAQPLTS